MGKFANKKDFDKALRHASVNDLAELLNSSIETSYPGVDNMENVVPTTESICQRAIAFAAIRQAEALERIANAIDHRSDDGK